MECLIKAWICCCTTETLLSGRSVVISGPSRDTVTSAHDRSSTSKAEYPPDFESLAVNSEDFISVIELRHCKKGNTLNLQMWR
ncbi:hypothetical protein L596_000808 [Steinernema carpocapsae]|uniref:Uncharacterized protein n=1 Tax=Steinernema carpocapsae TaxID=34508 RepID=A0A4U8UJI5_STECR|nr:hypothetical protein L596_000808 [Steinernema carpocapsae]